jgi:ParB-like chromosome segregation protein Spo0J
VKRKLTTVTICDLLLPGDWKQRLKSEQVRRLSGSGEILQPPAIRAADKSVIWGGDRLAAMHLGGRQTCEVWMLDVDEDTAEEMRLVENAHRRHDNRDDLLDRLVALQMRRLEDRKQRTEQLPYDSDDNSERQPGRPKTVVGEAREVVAAAVGTTTEAVRQAQARVAAGAQSGAGEPGSQPAGAAPPLGSATPGLDITVALDGIDKLLTSAVTAITKLAKEHPELTERFPLQDLKWELQRKVAPGIRAMKPIGSCGYCKGYPGELENCAACRGSNWLTSDQVKDIPPDLLIVGEGAGIYREGEFVTLAALAAKRSPRVVRPTVGRETSAPAETSDAARHADSRERPASAKPGKHVDIRVVRDDGSEESWLEPWTDTK